MQVTLNIEAGQLGETVVDLFKSITPEQKKELAVQVITKWFEEPHGFERSTHESRLIREIQSGERNIGYYNNEGKGWSEEKIRDSYQFKQLANTFVSSREMMVKEIITETVKYYKEKVDTLVLNDPQINNYFETVKEELIKKFPELSQTAVSFWFSERMREIGDAVRATHNNTDTINQMFQDINKRLQQGN